MALQTLDGAGLWVPPTMPFLSVDGSSFLIDASGEVAVAVLRCPRAGNIDRFDAYIGAVGNSPDNGLRFSIQGVSNVTGLQDGVILGATGNGFVTYAHPVVAGWKATTFGEVVTVARNQLIACVIDIPTFTAGDSVTVYGVLPTNQGFPHGISATSTKIQGTPIIALHYTDGYANIGAYLSAYYLDGTVAYAVDTVGADEWGLGFQVPWPCKLNRVRALLQIPAGANFECVVYNAADGVLSTLAHDGDVTPTGATRGYDFYTETELSLLPNVTYRVTFRPTTTTMITMPYMEFFSSAHMNTIAGGTKLFLTSRLNQAGSWTNYNSGTFRRPFMSLELTAFDDGVSAGGSGGGQGSTIYLSKKDSAVQKSYSSKTTDVNLAASDSGKNDVVAVKSANHQLWVQKIVYNPITVAAQAVTFQDDAGSPVKIGVIPASQATPITLDYGPKGVALTAGKNLDISNTAGPAAQIHIEAYENIVSGAISTATVAAGQ